MIFLLVLLNFLYTDASANVPLDPSMGTPTVGNGHSFLKIVYFFDYKCSFCRKMDQTIAQFHQENPEAQIVYRPLPFLGIESKIVAQAALAAHRQYKFQVMHQWLVTEGYRATEEQIIEHAAALGMNPVQFQYDLKSSDTEKMIDDNLKIALKNRILTVPGLIINTKVVQEFLDYSEFIQAVQHSAFN